MRRRRIVFGAAILSMIVLGLGVLAVRRTADSAKGADSVKSRGLSPSPSRVLLVGDSLAYQSSGYFKSILAGDGATAYTATYGGTALCDWLPILPALLRQSRPSVVELEFYGDHFTPCSTRGTSASHPLTKAYLVENYAAAARASAIDIRAAGARAVWVVAPVSSSNDPLPLLIAKAEYGASRQIVPSILDNAGSYVLAGGKFTRSLPCLTWEPCPPIDGQHGMAIVRSPDGLHFCPVSVTGAKGQVGRCPVWSSGAWRFAAAMAGPVVGSVSLSNPPTKPPLGLPISHERPGPVSSTSRANSSP